MRSIKFRAWNSQTKRFIQDDVDVENRENHDLGNYALDPSGVLYFFQSDEGGMSVLDKKDVEIMQYTGLKDKNGTEIYFQDFVRVFGGTKHERIDEVIWNEYQAGFALGQAPSGNLFGGEQIEVIGNVWESPELIAKLQ